VIIHGYIQSFPDEIDTLPDALDSLASFCDHIYVVDGGFGSGTLCQHPRYTTPIKEWLYEQTLVSHVYTHGPAENRYDGDWNGVPLTLWERPFDNPGSQRNYTLSMMLQEPEQPAWIAWCDSDEVFSNEFIRDVRSFLEGLSLDITNVCPKWFTLIQDEQHYTPSHSSWLSHARLHHPGICQWSNSWHESMSYIGKRVNFDRHVIHTRMLFRRRLLIQRGHSVVNEGAWAGVTAEPIPDGVTWNLHWPEGEPVGVPYNADIRSYEEGRWITI
jgi:hypothetical protein